MISRFKKSITIVVLLVIIFVFLHIKSHPRLSVFYEINQDENNSTFDAELTSILIDTLNQLEIPGMQVAIKIYGGVHNYNIGTVDYERTERVGEDNVFKIASVTKIFTSTLVLKLAEEGYFNLDDTIDKWFPELINSETITIRTLLNHTSGVYSYTENFALQCKALLNPRKLWTEKEIYEYILKGKPAFEPREEYRYSNSNYVLLGIICEKATGMEYEELLYDKIIDKLNLQNTCILPYDETPEKLVKGYDRDVIPLGIKRIETFNDSLSSLAYSAGAIVSNCNDLIEFYSSLLSGEIISDKYLDEMMTFIDCTDEDLYVQTGYGLGLRRFEIGGHVLIGHTGTIPGYGGLLMYNADKDYIIAALANISYFNQIAVLTEIINYIDSREANSFIMEAYDESCYICRWSN